MHEVGSRDGQGGVEALIAGYVAGTLPAALHALVAAHLDLSARNRPFVRALEAAAGSALESDERADATLPAISSREAKLAAIFALEAAPASPPARTAPDDVLPAALARFVGRPVADIPWRRLLPGVRTYRVRRSGAGQAVLLWVRAGGALPMHTHEGAETTLLLTGGFSDVTGHYRRGDIALADPEIDHHPVADSDEDCLCFIVTDAPLRLTGPIGRLIQPFLPRRRRRQS